MALRLTQVTIPAAGSQPVRVTATRTPIVMAVIQPDDGATTAIFVGDSTLNADGSDGIRLNGSATVAEKLTLGPFSAVQHFDLSEIYLAGTADALVNILYWTL